MSVILELLMPVLIELIKSLIQKDANAKAAICASFVAIGKASTNPVDQLAGQAAACYAAKDDAYLKAELATGNAMTSAYATYQASQAA